MTICFQEFLSCCVGRPTTSPPTQPSRRRGATCRKAAEGPPWCLIAAHLSNLLCPCPASPRVTGAAVLPLIVPWGNPGCCQGLNGPGSSPFCPLALPAYHRTCVSTIIPVPSCTCATQVTVLHWNRTSRAVIWVLLLLRHTSPVGTARTGSLCNAWGKTC